jgi:hypothetical protein
MVDKMRLRPLGIFILLTIFLLPPSVFAAFTPIETTISMRQSIKRTYTNQPVLEPQLLELLRAAYGNWGNHKSVPQIGSNYSLTVYSVNATGSYRYIPEENILVIHDLTVKKDNLTALDYQNYFNVSDTVLLIFWNQTRMNNFHFASAEAGCFAQNMYLAAASLGIGTVSVGGIREDEIRDALHLPSTMQTLLAMPVSYPIDPYIPASPDYTRMNGNLPLVLNSNLSLADALNNLFFTQTWSPQELSSQELSQLLWAAYGYSSNLPHRTTPSAFSIYPLIIVASNATGVYQYTPDSHSIKEIVTGDKRFDLANAFGGETWAANASTLFLILCNSTLGGDDSIDHRYMNINAGAVVQDILLEASAWNLSGNTLSKGLEDWNGTGAQEIRNILSLPSTIIPMYSVPIGHKAGYNLNIRVRDWDLADNLQGANVYKDSDVKTSDADGWANWTDVTGTVEIKVKWLGEWVNGTFSITMDGDKTINAQSNVFDVAITCSEPQQQGLLQYANVTVFDGANVIASGITGADGGIRFVNVPNATLTFRAYDGNMNGIGSDNRTIITDEQNETLTCNTNYVNLQTEWKITEVWVTASLGVPAQLLIVIVGFPGLLHSLKKGTKMFHAFHKGGEKQK